MKIGLALVLALSEFLVSASASTRPSGKPHSGDTVISISEDPAEGLIIPRNSPVRFRGFDKESQYARFDGRFVLTGSFSYGCDSDCGQPLDTEEENALVVQVVPDKALAARLPHWKVRNNDILIMLQRDPKLLQALVTPRQRASIRSGKLASLHGRVSIVVDDFQTGLECDSANYAARFISFVKPKEAANVKMTGDYGCGAL